jgi:hydrogenase maturation factor
MVDYNGRKMKLKAAVPDLKPGEYVMFSAGIALDRIEREEALAILGEL